MSSKGNIPYLTSVLRFIGTFISFNLEYLLLDFYDADSFHYYRPIVLNNDTLLGSVWCFLILTKRVIEKMLFSYIWTIGLQFQFVLALVIVTVIPSSF